MLPFQWKTRKHAMEKITGEQTVLSKQAMPCSVEDGASEPESWALTRLSKPMISTNLS